jgi:ferritin-like metal-binding protein YciE
LLKSVTEVSMTEIQSLRVHLVDELVDLRDAENQLIKALPKLAEAAASKALRIAFEKHLKETRGHLTRITQALHELGETPRSKTCGGMQGLLEEGESMMKSAPAGPVRDAVMITGAQKVEHYEMASYGTARTYARVLGEKAVARLLEQTLKEEKTADRTLTGIAEKSVNRRAASEWQSRDEGPLNRAAEWVGKTAGYATGQLTKGVRVAASAVGVATDRSGKTRSGGTSMRQRNHSSAKRAGTRKR